MKTYEGTLTGRGFVGKVYVKKSDIKPSVLEQAQRVRIMRGGEWRELATWGSCKLVARRMGAVTRYARQHYGQYDCCLEAEVELSGAARYGVSKASMPIWMRMSLDGFWPKSWPKGKVRSWTRTSMESGHVVVESNLTGKRYRIQVRRGLVDGSNIVHSLDEAEATRRLIEQLNG